MIGFNSEDGDEYLLGRVTERVCRGLMRSLSDAYAWAESMPDQGKGENHSRAARVNGRRCLKLLTQVFRAGLPTLPAKRALPVVGKRSGVVPRTDSGSSLR